MSKAFGMHMIALKPGVKAEDFERYVTEQALPNIDLPGVQYYLLKGDRGDRQGRYLVMMAFESEETRKRYFPAPGEMSVEVQQVFFASNAATFAKWDSFATPLDVIYTDYVEVGG